MGQLNRNNFLTFYSASTGITPLRSFVGNDTYDGFIIWPNNEVLSIWVNIPNLPQVNYRCKLVAKSNTEVVATFSNLTPYNYTISAVGYTYPYGEMTLGGSVRAGFYQLRLESENGGVVTQIGLSNPIYVCSLTKAQTMGNLFRFRNKFSMHGVMYAHDTNFYQRMWLPIGMTQSKPETESTVHKDWRTGQVSMLNVKSEMVHEMVTYHAGRWFHDAGALLARHTNIQINGHEYIGRGSYSIEPIGIDGNATARFDVVELENSTIQVCS